MKYIIGIVAVLVGLIAVVALGGSSNTTANTQNGLTMSTITTDISNGSQLVDVRTPEEFAAGYVDSAVNLPLGNIESGTMPTSAKDKKLYLYCRSGNRSAEAKSILEKNGFTNVVDLGAMTDVIALGGTQVK